MESLIEVEKKVEKDRSALRNHIITVEHYGEIGRVDEERSNEEITKTPKGVAAITITITLGVLGLQEAGVLPIEQHVVRSVLMAGVIIALGNYTLYTLELRRQRGRGRKLHKLSASTRDKMIKYRSGWELANNEGKEIMEKLGDAEFESFRNSYHEIQKAYREGLHNKIIDNTDIASVAFTTIIMILFYLFG